MLLALFFAVAFSATRDLGEAHKVIYYVVDSVGDYVAGQTIALSVQKVSNGYWYDFNDSAFKGSGWTSKTVTMLGDETNGFYYYLWTPPAVETDPEEYLFSVDNSDATYGDHQGELVSYLDIAKPSDVIIYIGE